MHNFFEYLISESIFDLNRLDMAAYWYKEKATNFYEKGVAYDKISTLDKLVHSMDVVEEVFYDNI